MKEVKGEHCYDSTALQPFPRHHHQILQIFVALLSYSCKIVAEKSSEADARHGTTADIAGDNYPWKWATSITRRKGTFSSKIYSVLRLEGIENRTCAELSPEP